MEVSMEGVCVIDTSTPENLERDFYAWLYNRENTFYSTSTKCDEKSALSEYSLFFTPTETQNLTTILQTTDPKAGSNYGFITQALYGTPSSESATVVVESSGIAFTPEKVPDILYAALPSVDGIGATVPTSDNTVLLSTVTTSGMTSSNGSPSPIGLLGVSAPAGSIISQSIDIGEQPSSSSDLSRKDKGSVGKNQLGRTYSPGIPLSMADRAVIVQLFEEGHKICDISKRLCVTHSCVSKILNRYRKTGSVRPKDSSEGREETPIVKAIREYRKIGIATQSEIRERLIADGYCTRECAPSRSSINHILRTKIDMKKRRVR